MSIQALQTRQSFEDISRNIWAEIQMGNNAGPDPCPSVPYNDDFYESGIDFPALIRYIRSGYSQNFNYENFQGPIDSYPSAPPYPSVIPIQSVYFHHNNLPFTYKLKDRTVSAVLSGRLNKRICLLEKGSWGLQYGRWFTLDAKNNIQTGGLEFYYRGTFQFRKDAGDTPEKNDYTISDNYRAIVITAQKPDDYVALFSELYGNDNVIQNLKDDITARFVKEISLCKEASELKFLYESLPEFVISNIVNKRMLNIETVWKHALALIEFDQFGLLSIFRDASSALINAFRVISDPKILFEKFRNDPKLLKKIYRGLDDSSEIENKQVSNKIIFSNFMYALCLANQNTGLEIKGDIFSYGFSYRLDANITGLHENDDEFFLRQIVRRPAGDMDFLPEAATEDIPGKPSGYYHPLDLVTLRQISDNGSETDILVPAIFLKALSDEEELQEIMQNIRIGLDVVMLISGAIAVATTGNPFIFAFAMADIGLATTDLAVQSFREEIKALDGGKEFLETWEKIYLVGSAITAAPALISSFLRIGVKVLNAASLLKSANASKFITTCFTKIFLEIRIANFVDNTVKDILYADRAITGSGLPLTAGAATRLQQEGVMFVRSLNAQKETVGIAAVYRGEVIAAGKAARIKELLKDVWSANGAALTKELEALWQMVPKLDESKKFWAAINRAGNECRWDNQLGNTAESIEAATKSKDLGKVWEGEVGKAVQEFEKVLNFGSPVEIFSKGKYIQRAGEYDILTTNYIIECKLKYRSNLLNQLDKYVNPANSSFINFSRKKVILVIKSTKQIPHSFINELAKNKIILIQGINQIQKLKIKL